MTITRRQLLGGLAAAGLTGLTGRARAIGDGSKLEIIQLHYAGNWNPRPGAARKYSIEVHERTSIDVKILDWTKEGTPISDPKLFYHPFAMLLGDGRFRFDAGERARLKSWIEAGGFLLIDDSGLTSPSQAFDASVRSELTAMFPGRELISIPMQHVLFRSFYVVDSPVGRAIHKNSLEGLFIEDRLAVVYSRNDLMGALDLGRTGHYAYDVVPGGDRQREQAIALAINIVQYAMCLDYKDDQVHLDYLLRQRRWRITPPKIESP